MLQRLIASLGLALWMLAGNAFGEEFLPADEAFEVSIEEITAEAIHLRWTVTPEYYLYRGQLAARTAGDSAVELGELELPRGRTLQDPWFGRQEVYEQSFAARLPWSGPLPAEAEVELVLRHQGCAKAGLCYPPQETRLTARLDDAAAPPSSSAAPADPAAESPATHSDSAAAGAVSEQDRLGSLLAGGSLLWTVPAFFVAGLLLALTPCVLPMVPILSGIIVGNAGRGGRRRALVLSLAYVLPMAAVYAAGGVLAGVAGASLQATLQSPWVLVPFAGLFVLLALSLFGLYELRLPAALEHRLSTTSSRLPGGQLSGVMAMGALSALVVGPCMTAPLAGALLYIGQTGDAVTGGIALFSLGLGMGLPLVVAGVLGGGLLPRAGAWMQRVQHVFGLVLLAVALWLLERVLPAPLLLALWGLLALAVAMALGALTPLAATAPPAAWLRRSLGLAAAAWGLLLLIGAASGGGTLLQPLEAWAQPASMPSAPRVETLSIRGLDALQETLDQAAGRPVVVDFYADWCVSCKVMERTVFAQPEVVQALSGAVRIQPDVTANDALDRQLLQHYGVVGPPTLLFLDAQGRELEDLRLVGEVSANRFLHHLQRALEES